MEHRELLEKAATAAGLGLPGKDDADPIGRQYSPGLGLWVRWKWGDFAWFHPTGDGRHALWLAVELGLQVMAYPMYDEPKHSAIVRKPVWNHDTQEGDGVEVVELYGGDPHGATWRAITLAAAAIDGLNTN